MTEEEQVARLEEAAQAKARAKEEARQQADAIIDAANQRFDQAVADALRLGMKPKRVAEITGYSYEVIRRIARAQGVERLREPTVTSRKKASH